MTYPLSRFCFILVCLPIVAPRAVLIQAALVPVCSKAVVLAENEADG